MHRRCLKSDTCALVNKLKSNRRIGERGDPTKPCSTKLPLGWDERTAISINQPKAFVWIADNGGFCKSKGRDLGTRVPGVMLWVMVRCLCKWEVVKRVNESKGLSSR